MQLRTLVVDDEAAFYRSMAKILERQPNQLKLLGNARSVYEAVSMIDDQEPDLIFLDIRLPDGTGFEILKKVSFRDFKVIFVTAFNEYAIDAFKFSAIDYLLKPIVTDELWSAVERARIQIDRTRFDLKVGVLMENINELSQGQKKLVLKDNDSLHMVRLDEIIWCTADGSYTTFYLVNGERLVVSQNLKEYESVLDRNGFFRIHRSHLVNINKIKRFDKREGGVIYLEDGSSLPVSTRKKEKLAQYLNHLI